MSYQLLFCQNVDILVCWNTATNIKIYKRIVMHYNFLNYSLVFKFYNHIKKVKLTRTTEQKKNVTNNSI